jgi:hypothetical protein
LKLSATRLFTGDSGEGRIQMPMVRHQLSKRKKISYTRQKTLIQRTDSLAFAFTIFVKKIQKPKSALCQN